MLANDLKFTILIVTLLILLLIAVIIITNIASNRKLVQQQVHIAQMQTDYEKELRLTEQEVQEQVLVNVGRELHDNIGQRLTYINMLLEQQKFINPTLKESMAPLGETVNNTIAELRRISKSLNSDLLEDNGLVKTIDMEVMRLRQLNYTIDWQHDEEPALGKDQKVIVFRIFQEIINNMLKHAAAKNITINLRGADRFFMEVKDDGRGFDAAAMLQSASGSGLKNMTKRAKLAKLNYRIESVPGNGSTFTLEQIT
jgi:signal transduction histidine kinase